jgi:hypothetical protein
VTVKSAVFWAVTAQFRVRLSTPWVKSKLSEMSSTVIRTAHIQRYLDGAYVTIPGFLREHNISVNVSASILR